MTTMGDLMIDPSLITHIANRTCDICLPMEAAKMLVLFDTAMKFGYIMLGVGIMFGTFVSGWFLWRVLLVKETSD
jgi:hypothetical protein